MRTACPGSCLDSGRARPAQSAVSGVVRDEAGAVGLGRVGRLSLGTSRPRAADGHRPGRPLLACDGPGRRPDAGRPRRRIRRVDQAGAAHRRTRRSCWSRPTLFESVTVTPTRTEKRLGDVPASVNVIDKETIRQSPAVVADDVLRLVPTFSLFRRTSSLSAHPTAQGVSLRGIGPSGVSRSLVLIDGVPFNDPFGGWVYWTRVPLESVDRIEVVDGSSSSVYGNYAHGRRDQRHHRARRGRARSSSGRSTATTTARRPTSSPATCGASWACRSRAAPSTPTGFPIVIANERGLIDNNARSRTTGTST